jgi:hypothetical protein
MFGSDSVDGFFLRKGRAAGGGSSLIGFRSMDIIKYVVNTLLILYYTYTAKH